MEKEIHQWRWRMTETGGGDGDDGNNNGDGSVSEHGNRKKNGLHGLFYGVVDELEMQFTWGPLLKEVSCIEDGALNTSNSLAQKIQQQQLAAGQPEDEMHTSIQMGREEWNCVFNLDRWDDLQNYLSSSQTPLY
ncbi:hypothetical protein LguiA_021028 [Lonicera macranthoides]